MNTPYKLVQPGMAFGNFTEALIFHEVNWVLIPVTIREIPFNEMEKTSLYPTLIDHKITWV